MNDETRQYLSGRLQESRTTLFGTVAGFTDEQWSFRPDSQHWTAAEIFEHVMHVESRVQRGIQRYTATEPQPDRKPAIKDEDIPKVGENRSVKLQAPEPVRPTGALGTPAEMLAAFDGMRAKTLKFIAETDADLRCHFFPHMLFGDLDCYQWLLLLSYHSDRHAAQIQELKADPGFPPLRQHRDAQA